MNGTQYDVAVLGGGISGLYAAWRLAASEMPGFRRVCVIESAPSIGGRIETIDPPVPGGRLDLGAMRFMSDHHMVQQLTEALKVPTRRVATATGGRGLYHLRGSRFRAAELFNRSAKLPYRLDTGEQGMHPDDLFEAVTARALAESGWEIPRDRQGWNELKKSGSFRGTPLDDLGFWNVAAEFLSAEAYAYLRDANGYDCNNWAAAEVMQTQLASFGKDASYQRFTEGTASLAIALAKAAQAAGAHILTGHRAVAVSSDDAGTMTVSVSTRTGTHPITSTQVIVSMPPRAVTLVDIPWLPELRTGLDAVVSQPALKILLGFPSPWWEAAQLGITGGRSNTDLPIRQVYYLDDHHVGRASPTLMIACNDDRAYDYFQPLPARAVADLQDPSRDLDPVLRRVLHHTVSQLETLHGVRIPAPIWIALRDWAHEPFGGAYHGWRPGRRGWETAARLRRPVPGVGLHLCGSAFSDLPTWMEGALGNTEQLLREVFALPTPAWLRDSTYLGW